MENQRWLNYLLIMAVMLAFYVLVLGILICLARWRAWDIQKMGSVPQAIATLIGSIALVIGWSVSNIQSIERDVMTKKREQSSAIAEYVALATSLKTDDNENNYRRANQLSWQLYLWLPDDVYRQLGRGLSSPHGNKELVNSLVAVRKSLLGNNAGTLGPDDIIVHGPRIGLPKSNP